MTGPKAQPPLKSLVWPMRLTLAGLWAERLARAFWPLWSLALVTLAALAFGIQDLGPLHYAQAAGAVLGIAALARSPGACGLSANPPRWTRLTG